MKLTSTQKIIIASVAIGVAAIIVVVLLIVPMFGTLTQLEVDRQITEQQKQQAQSLLGQLEQAKLRAASTQAELLRIGTELPDSPQLPTLIIELQDMANQSGVALSTLSPSQPAPVAEKNVTEIPVTMNITNATWADLLDFMRRLNKSTRLLRVTDISITRGTASSSTEASAVIIHKPPNVLNVALSLKAYVIGTNGQIAPGEAAPAPGAPASGATQ
jgi:Tfp pilus assembly protein PilO